MPRIGSADKPSSLRLPGPGALLAALILAGIALHVLASGVQGQIPGEFQSTEVPAGEGWSGFSNLAFLLDALLDLVLAGTLGAVIGFHPRRIRTADTLEEIEGPKVSIVYAVIGSLIGILVMEYDLVVGFVLFGIGGLIRFRSAMGSAQLTGQVIFATLIGLTCGLHLPHVAVLATIFDFVLTFILEARVTYQVDVRGLPPERFGDAVKAYREALSGQKYEVLSEKKNPRDGRIRIIFRCAGKDPRSEIEGRLQETVDPVLQGTLNWQID
ncbi:MAG: hypothetical protein P8188_08055 [Gemmatimonadota bacterium]|jgi:hypothetical protein